jgi:3-oxoacyl-(acyl-carrier-protein) synthase III
MAIGIVDIGAYVPARIVTNTEVAAWTGASLEWLQERTGIEERRYASTAMRTSAMAAAAAGELVDRVGRDAIRFVAVATSTPDQPQPATAALVQRQLGIDGAAAFDVNAVCSGFVYALVTTEALLHRTGSAGDVALVIGADMYSRIMDRSDRRTVSLFGDGAGAVLLGEVPEGYGLRGSFLTTFPEDADLIRVEAGGTALPLTEEARSKGQHLFRMEGRQVRDRVLQIVPKVVDETLSVAGVRLDEVHRVIIHQGNPRLVASCAEVLGLDPLRVPLTATHLGNTAAASVPLTLAATHRATPLRRGENVLLLAVGGGISAGAALITWY